MEDVLAVYTRPRNSDCPLVCLDETSKQLVAETRVPMPMKAGRPARFDYEYQRNGTVNLFMMFAPLEGWRHVKVTDRHTAVDYAHVLKDLADIHFAHAKTIVLVQDNLSIHSKASLYEAFPAVEARRLVERFEWHYTPKHGSWLDLAESELGVLTCQCLDRRIPDKQTLIDEIAAWEHDRNANHTKADWQFTTKNARIKLKHLYPSICRVTGIAGRLLFSLQQRISFCLFGCFARCLSSGRSRGVGCCLRSNLGLLCKFALLALPRFFTLHRALGSHGGDGLALLSFLDGSRPFDERRFEFCQHQLLGLGCVFEPLFQVRDASIAHEIVLMLLVRPARENGEIGGIAYNASATERREK